MTESTAHELLEPQNLGLRPQRLEEFIGQPDVREHLRIYIEAARERGEALDHTLFFGPPGLGKTTLAHVLAEEMGSHLHQASGPVLEKPGDLVGLLTRMEEGDVVFIDEIHRLRADIEEFLYSAMEDYQIEIRVQNEEGRTDTLHMDLEAFTLVGATTRFGLLTAPLRARFGVTERLDFYPTEELEAIIHRSSQLLDVPITETGAREIARRARGTPRIANRLLKRVRDVAQVEGEGEITHALAQEALEMLGVDREGLDELDLQILTTLVDDFCGGPVGLSSLATSIGEDETTLEEVFEPYLIQQGFLTRTRQGRVATRKAWKHLDREIPADVGTNLNLFEEEA